MHIKDEWGRECSKYLQVEGYVVSWCVAGAFIRLFTSCIVCNNVWTLESTMHMNSNKFFWHSQGKLSLSLPLSQSLRHHGTRDTLRPVINPLGYVFFSFLFVQHKVENFKLLSRVLTNGWCAHPYYLVAINFMDHIFSFNY